MSKPRHFGLHFPGCARRRGKECNAPGSKDPQLQAPCLCGPPPCGALHDTRVSSDPPIRSLRGQTTRVSCLPKPWPGRLLVSTAAHADQWPPAVRRSPCGTTACFCGGSSLWVMTLAAVRAVAGPVVAFCSEAEEAASREDACTDAAAQALQQALQHAQCKLRREPLKGSPRVGPAKSSDSPRGHRSVL